MTPVLIVAISAALAWMHSMGGPTDRVVLLPDADGGHGAVIVRSAAGERVIDQTYLTAEVGRDGVISTRQEDRATVQLRYRDAIDAMPLPSISLTVYFFEGTTDLTPESRPVLDQLRNELARRPAAEIAVIGHTDRVGKVEDNDALSRRRAEAVKTWLIGAGFSAAQIETSGRGERQPLVPTADEVVEPRNRRVEINVR